MSEFTSKLSSIFLAALISAVAAVVSTGQTASTTPDGSLPTQPTFDTANRPLPDMSRIGIQNGNDLSLSLEEAIEMALKNNNDIDTSRNDLKTADLSLLGARGAYDPLLSSENYFERVTTPTASLIGGAVNGAVTTTRAYDSFGIQGLSPRAGGSYSAVLNAARSTTSNTNSFLNPQFPSAMTFSYTQPLWRNRRIDASRRNIAIARKGIEISDAQLEQKAIDVVTNVEKGYWDLVYALRNLQVQNETLSQARLQLESNRRLVAKGVLAPIELVAAQAQIAGIEQLIFQAKENLTRSENTLKTLILPDRSSIEWSHPITPITKIDQPVPQIGLEVAMGEAIKNRPEIAQYAGQVEQNLIDQRFYRNQTKPQIDLVATYTTQGLAGTETPAAISPTTGLSRVPVNLVGGYFNSLGNLFQQDYPTFRASVVISLPFGNRVAKANYGKALVDAERIANRQAQGEQAIEADVRNALQALRTAESKLGSASVARNAAEELYASEERQFKAGTTTFYLVLQRQTDLMTARSRELQARTDLNKAISEFQRSIGATLRSRNISVSK